MNLRLISRILGLLMAILCLFMGICMAYAFLQTPREIVAIEAFGKTISFLLLTSCLFFVIGRKTPTELLRKEAIAVVGLSWICCANAGALPYYLMDEGLGFVDAVFESMSGFTTTGATVIQDLDQYPRSILLWRAITQWLGGLGILVLFVALLSYLGVGSKALFSNESSAQSTQGLQARIHDIALKLWQIYLILTILCFFGLFLLGMSPFQSITYALTAISTGGFGIDNTSVAAYDSPSIEIWLTLFMILGSISFILYAWLLQKKWERWKMEEEAKWFLIIIAISTLAIALDLAHRSQTGTSFLRGLRLSLFHVVSVITTTGFVASDYNTWEPFSKILLLILMCLGGCAGSTAGGLKIGRWLLFAKVLRQQITNAYRPTHVLALKLNGQTIKSGVRAQTLFLLTLGGTAAMAGTAFVSILEPQLDMDSSISATLACLFNIGPGLSKVGPTENFAFLGGPSKVVLTLLMLLGRLEFFAVLVLFSPTLWKAY
jgi:trk system potassium uptake protein TrkH